MSSVKKIDAKLSPVGISPSVLIRSYDDKDWETFIEEWATGFEPKYNFVEGLGGAGDKGRDVRAYVGPPNDPKSEWDNYQCKRYKGPVQPSEMWTDFGKVIFYTQKRDYSIPRKYRIVAPMEVSPTLKELLKNADKLREGLRKNWSAHCEKKITDTVAVPLQGDLLRYFDAFDFGIFGYIPVVEILTQHARTPFWDIRFKEKPPARPPVSPPPTTPTQEESRYVAQLMEAYADSESLARMDAVSLASYPEYSRHYQRSREDFYKADSLYRFTKDIVALGSFEEFKQQIFDGVIDVHEGQFLNAFARLKATTQEAVKLPPVTGYLGALATKGDIKGACHHLANEDKLTWKR